MTPDEVRLDGIRSYELAIKTARKQLLRPTEDKLNAAIKTLRECGFTVRLAEGNGVTGLWNCGPLPKLGYYEVLRLAKKATIPPQMDASMIPLRPWPDMPKDAFR